MKASLLIAMAIAAPLIGQTPCEDNQNRGDRNRGHCEMREYTIANAGRLDVDSSLNGGIRITGEDRSNVLVRAKVQGRSDSVESAKAMVAMVRVEATPGHVRASGPQNLQDASWSVSYEILVPRRTALILKAHNGGINIADVEGDIQFQTLNGGVNLKRLAGDVRGKTQNGGVQVELAGNTWHGSQLDVQTTNGGVQVSVPQNYSARFESSTVNGKVQADFPGVQVEKGKTDRNVSLTLGSGGPLVRIVTTNGGIQLRKS